MASFNKYPVKLVRRFGRLFPHRSNRDAWFPVEVIRDGHAESHSGLIVGLNHGDNVVFGHVVDREGILFTMLVRIREEVHDT